MESPKIHLPNHQPRGYPNIPNSWMVYFMETPNLKWMRTGGIYPILTMVLDGHRVSLSSIFFSMA